jgi:hypothetical protein
MGNAFTRFFSLDESDTYKHATAGSGLPLINARNGVIGLGCKYQGPPTLVTRLMGKGVYFCGRGALDDFLFLRYDVDSLLSQTTFQK